MPENKNSTLESFQKFLEVIAQLRNPNGGCPWDLEQTHQTLKPYVIEEAFEVVDAIDQGQQALCSELGDLLLQVVLHAQIASENNDFNMKDIIDAVTEKMIKRHPHVFADVKAHDAKQVLKNWEEIKQKELKKDQSILDGVPKSMPALLRSQRIGEKAARVGFEWPTLEGVRDKVYEEMQEFLQSVSEKSASSKEAEDEFGDILFALTQLSRRLNFNAEDLLNRACNKFTNRFKKVEQLCEGRMKEMSIDELDELWEKVKSQE